MSSAVSEVQFPIANGSVSSLLNLRNNILRARSLQIVGGRHCNLESCWETIDPLHHERSAVPHTHLFWARFKILSSFSDPMASGRNCSSFVSSTSSEKKKSQERQHIIHEYLRLSTLQSNTIEGSFPSLNWRIVACVMSAVCTLSPICGTPKILVLGIWWFAFTHL